MSYKNCNPDNSNRECGKIDNTEPAKMILLMIDFW